MNQKFYRNPDNGQIYGFPLDGSEDWYIPEHWIRLTPEEEEAHLNPTIPALTEAEIRDLRRYAYADIVTGSDKLFIEYQREIAMGAVPEVIEQARLDWLTRAMEIEAQYPWPAMP